MTRPSHVSRLRVGDATVTLVATARGWRFRPPYMVSDDDLIAAAGPDADANARLTLDYTSVHVALGGRSVVIDPARLTADQRRRYAASGAEITPGLDAAGIDPEAVTDVVLGHRHLDHFTGALRDEVGACLTYPNARHHAGRADWEGADDELFARLRLALGRTVCLTDQDVDIAPGLRLLATPGETPGHLAVRVESRGQVFLWLGDLVHHRLELDRLDWVLANSDRAALERSRRRVLADAAATDAVVLWAHARFPGWGRVSAAPDGRFRWTPRPPGGAGS